MNDEERGRKREKNIKKRRKARVSIVIDFLNSHSACSWLQEGGGDGSKSAKTVWELGRTETVWHFGSKFRHRFNRGP